MFLTGGHRKPSSQRKGRHIGRKAKEMGSESLLHHCDKIPTYATGAEKDYFSPKSHRFQKLLILYPHEADHHSSKTTWQRLSTPCLGVGRDRKWLRITS